MRCIVALLVVSFLASCAPAVTLIPLKPGRYSIVVDGKNRHRLGDLMAVFHTRAREVCGSADYEYAIDGTDNSGVATAVNGMVVVGSNISVSGRVDCKAP